MPTGHYRFRSSFGNVGSLFRGARFDTYPLIPYPTEGRVLDLGEFTYTDSEVPDISGENNPAILYSGRAANLAGADYLELPALTGIDFITIQARSSTDSFIYATDDATQTNDALAIITANGTWQIAEFSFFPAITGKIRIGTNGASFFSGDIASIKCYNSSNQLIEEFFVNEHTDTSANGLDGLPLIGRNGNIGQYVGCAAVVQLSVDSGGLTPPQVLGMDFNNYQWFNRTDTRVDLGAITNFGSSDFFISADIFIGALEAGTVEVVSKSDLSSNREFRISLKANQKVQIILSSSGSSNDFILESTLNYPIGKAFNLLIEKTGTTASIKIDGVSAGSSSSAPASLFASNENYFIGAYNGGNTGRFGPGLLFNVNINDQASYKGYGPTPWADTIGNNDGTESGAFENVLVPASLSNSSLDALGNTMDLRGSKELNADGSGYAEIADTPSLDLSTAGTWVINANSFGSTPPSSEAFLSKTSFSDNDRTVDISRSSAQGNNTINFTASSTGLVGSVFSKTFTVTDKDSWFVFVFDGSINSLKLYIDGVETSPSNENGSVPSAIHVNNKPYLILARPTAGGFSAFSNRSASDVKIYNRALTAEEASKFS